jgi:SnoaL-like domain
MITDTTTDIATAWTRLWNGEFDLAADLLDADFRIHFGAPADPAVTDAIHGPDAMVAHLTWYHEVHPDTRFTLAGPPIGGPDRIAFLWSAALPDGRRVSGIDIVALDAGRITEVWSVSGARRLPVLAG